MAIDWNDPDVQIIGYHDATGFTSADTFAQRLRARGDALADITDAEIDGAVRRVLATAEAEFYDRIRKALAELPPPSRWLQFQFFCGDCAWRVRRLFKP